MHPDGSEMHEVVEQPAVAISGVQWTASGWLGLSLIESEAAQRTLVILKPESCDAYRLPLGEGELEGLWVR
jgi:hypothetical protein